MIPVGVPNVMSTLLSSTAGISRPGNAATEHETYIPMAYRKSKRAHTTDDDESWVEDEITNTINLFDQGDTRTTQAILQPISIQDVRGIDKSQGGKGWSKKGVAYTLDTHATQGVAQPLNIYGGNKRSDRPEGGFYVRMDEDTSKTLDAASGLNPTANQGGTAVIQPKQMAVRRLTPRECERLQGFPDDHTLIPWRGRDASQCPDGPRYKALGNSMAVPVMRWIGERINGL